MGTETEQPVAAAVSTQDGGAGAEVVSAAVQSAAINTRANDTGIAARNQRIFTL